MKEKDLLPGTVYPVLGTLLFFLPERYREKLCCVTPLAEKVTSTSSATSSSTSSSTATLPDPRDFLLCVFQPRQPADEPPYQSGKKDGNGAAHHSKEDTIVEDKEMESSRQTEEEDESEAESRAPLPSCQLVAHSVQETSL